MLFVINKEKLCAYIVSILTVVILFCVTNIIKDNPDDSIPTSSNSYNTSVNSTNTADQ